MWVTDYKETEYSSVFEVADGDHRIKIVSAEEGKTKNNIPMIIVNYAVQDSNGVNYIDRYVAGEYFDKNITRFFDAFGIPRGNFVYSSWIGKLATARFEHRISEYQDQSGQIKSSNKAELTRLYTEPPAVGAAPVQQTAPVSQQNYQPNKAQVIF